MSAKSGRTSRGRVPAPGANGAADFLRDEDLLRALVDSLPDGLVITDAEGRILAVNARIEQMLGYGRLQLIGREVELLIPSRFRGPHAGLRAGFVADPRVRPMGSGRDLAARRKDGSELPVEISLSTLGSGGEMRVLALVRDVRERHAAELELRLVQHITVAVGEAPDFRAALAAALRPVCRLTGWAYGEAWVPAADGGVLEAGPALFGPRKALRIFRSGSQEMTFARGEGLPGRVWDTRAPEWVPDVSSSPVLTFRRVELAKEAGLGAALGVPVVSEGETLAVLVFFMLEARPEDNRLVMSVSAAAAQLGLVLKRKWAENEVRRLNADLERRVAERTTELEATMKELESFAYAVSHDLRAPLRAIDGFSQAIEEDCAPALGEEGRGHLRRVRDAAGRMSQLIDALLGLSRVTRRPLLRRRADLSALAREAAAELQRQEPGQRVEFVVAPGITARCDRDLIGIVLVNLIGNAWKFTAGTEGARIEFGAEERGGETVYFVRDNGAGFDMAYAGKLFGAFQRLHHADEYPGTGIGLATVQRIVHRHGGRAWAEGAVGRGATFYFTLRNHAERNEA